MGSAAVQIEPLGETMLLLRFGSSIDLPCNARVHAAASAIREAAVRGVRDLVPAYATLAIDYDPLAWQTRDANGQSAWQRLADALRPLLADNGATQNSARPIIEVPVCYGGESGPDLNDIAGHCSLRPDDVIARHTAVIYQVAMLGFAPGFPYLLGLDPSLHMPRRASPRLRVAPGSVAIGGAQTGIYPRELPGGWSLLGRTPSVLFDTARDPPALLAAGDRVRFVAIDRDVFPALQSANSPAAST